jgi:hypothetical protein
MSIDKMNIDFKYAAIVLFMLSFLVSCHKQPYEQYYEVPTFESNQSEFRDEELLNATYSTYKFPEDFYFENLNDTSIYYINTVSIDSLNKEKWIELSTNSNETALQWCKRSSPDSSEFTPGIGCEKFIEFVRVYDPSATHIIKFRAHKESYFTRGNYDFFNPSDTIGVFNKENFNGPDAKELIDYLWYTHGFNNGGSKILSSYFEENQLRIVVYHYESYTVYGDFGINDEISLLKKTNVFEKGTGIVTLSEVVVRTIEGKMN